MCFWFSIDVFFFFPVIESNFIVTSSQCRQFPTVLLAAHVHSNKLICLINREEQQGPRNGHKGIFFPSLEEKIEFDSQREEWKEVDTEQRGRIAVSTSTADGDEICRGENCRKKKKNWWKRKKWGGQWEGRDFTEARGAMGILGKTGINSLTWRSTQSRLSTRSVAGSQWKHHTVRVRQEEGAKEDYGERFKVEEDKL